MRTLFKAYLYGSVASSVSILLTILSAIVLRPVLSTGQEHIILSFLVALSVGCLSGNAIFHLLPHIFMCESEDGRHVHQEDVIWNTLPIACTIYAFYLMHLFSENFLPQKENSHFHSHSHPHSHLMEITKRMEVNNDEFHDNESIAKDSRKIQASEKCEKDFRDCPPIIWMIVIGDAIHSFIEGIAIGGGYAKSFYGGIGTTIAIVCHEVPHCVGDFGVMITTGLPHEKSLFLIVIVMLPVYAGTILGATLGQLMDLTRLIFAITAAMFLFISLTELLPGLLNSRSKGKSRWHLPVIHSVGIFLGMTGMLIVAVIEVKLSS